MATSWAHTIPGMAARKAKPGQKFSRGCSSDSLRQEKNLPPQLRQIQQHPPIRGSLQEQSTSPALGKARLLLSQQQAVADKTQTAAAEKRPPQSLTPRLGITYLSENFNTTNRTSPSSLMSFTDPTKSPGAHLGFISSSHSLFIKTNSAVNEEHVQHGLNESCAFPLKSW